MDIKIQLADSEIDLANEISFGLNYSIDDIRNVEKKNTNYSKTITLAGSDNNNKILGNLFDVNSDFTYFNPNIKTPAKIIVNSETVIEGFLQLKSIETQGKIEYKCVINSKAVDFFTDVKDKKLSDLDFSKYNHTYNSANITNSWNGNEKYVYPLMHNGTESNYEIRDFKPAIFHKEYLKRIALESGYSLGGALMDSTTEAGGHYAKEIIPFNGEVVPISDAELQRRLFEVGQSSSVVEIVDKTIGTDMVEPFTKLEIFDNEIFDNGSVFNNNTYTIDANGTYSVRFNFTGKVEVSTNGVDAFQSEYNSLFNSRDFATDYTYTVRFDIYQNGNLLNNFIKQFTLPNELNSSNGYTDNTNFNFILNTPIRQFSVGDDIEIQYTVQGKKFNDLNYTDSTGATPVTTTFKLKSFIGTTLKNSTGNSELVEGDTITLSNFIPKEVKQGDLITDLVKRYNAYISVDPNNDRKILINTREQYFASGGTLDWSDKQDMDSKVDIKLISELQNKEFKFTYKEDNDLNNEVYSNNNDDAIYGEKEVEFENDFVKGEKKIETPFSPTPLIQARKGKNFAIVPSIPTQAPKNKVRVLYYGGLIDTIDGINWRLTHAGGFDNYTIYPYAGHLDNPINPTVDINFGEVPTAFYPEFESRTNANLYNRFWKNYIEQLAIGKLVTMNMYLNSTDIGYIRHNLNTKIYVGNSYYYINKIVDYNPLKNDLTKVEFLKINEGVSFVGGVTVKTLGEPDDAKTALTALTVNNNENNGSLTQILGGGNFIGSDAEKIAAIGDNNIVNGKNGFIQGDGNRVSAGVENFFAIGALNKEITESNSGFIGDVFFKDGKIDKSSNSDTIANLKTKELIEGEIYYATDKGYYLQALTNDTFAPNGYVLTKCVKEIYYTIIGVYDEDADYVANDLVIYGNRVWKCLTSVPASQIDFNNLSSDFEEQEGIYYENKILKCNFSNDFTDITQVSDNKGNIVLNNTYGGFEYSDWNAPNTTNNICWGFMNNNCNVNDNNCKLIANNILNGSIFDNKNNGNIVRNSGNAQIFKNIN